MSSGKAGARPGRERAWADDDDSANNPSRSRRAKRPPTASEQLEQLLGYPWPFPGRPPKHDLSTWTVTDDWHDPVPVTEAESEVFDELFNSSEP